MITKTSIMGLVRNQDGFNLVELMITVGIIGILSSIASAEYNGTSKGDTDLHFRCT